jgi:hypothetical protein
MNYYYLTNYYLKIRLEKSISLTMQTTGGGNTRGAD